MAIMTHISRSAKPGAAMASVVEISEAPVPAEAFELFPGRWVAIDDGHIVADAATLEELDADERVGAADTRFRVPEEGAKFF
jgi:hypothetical protein